MDQRVVVPGRVIATRVDGRCTFLVLVSSSQACVPYLTVAFTLSPPAGQTSGQTSSPVLAARRDEASQSHCFESFLAGLETRLDEIANLLAD